MFDFVIQAQDGKARTGVFITPDGELRTPELAIVATQGEIKAIPQEYLARLNIPYLIVNTFHIYTQDILAKINKLGDIRHYMQLNHNVNSIIASDSGGFQVFSLGFGKSQGVGKVASIFPGIDQNCLTQDDENPLHIDHEGVVFEYDHRQIILNPEKSMDIQAQIGANIIFAFDECTSPLNSKQYTQQALKRTHAWLERSIAQHNQNQKHKIKKQALFGIVQGGAYDDLRIQASKILAQADVPGYGIGGSLGRNKNDMHRILEVVCPLLPQNKPRHLLGIGQVQDIFENVERGVDLFDCVIPTREARHKIIYTKQGRFPLRKLKNIHEPINQKCYDLDDANKITWAQLYELFQLKDHRAYRFATLHNIWFFNNLMAEIRIAIKQGSLSELKNTYLRQ